VELVLGAPCALIFLLAIPILFTGAGGLGAKKNPVSETYQRSKRAKTTIIFPPASEIHAKEVVFS
jgi:hypothetical protein